MDDTRITLLKAAKEPSNAFCADCGAPDPRWASWNLGVFICMRCAAIHRNMGAHISKVKSLQLDHWTDEQLKAFLNSGCNAQARKVYEALLPDSYIRPQSQTALENFIRAKYERRMFEKPNVTAIEKSESTNHVVSSAEPNIPTTDLIDFVTDSTSSTSTNGLSSNSNSDLLLCLGDNLGSPIKPTGATVLAPERPVVNAFSTRAPQFLGVSAARPQSTSGPSSNYLDQITQQLAAIKAQMNAGKMS